MAPTKYLKKKKNEKKKKKRKEHLKKMLRGHICHLEGEEIPRVVGPESRRSCIYKSGGAKL